MSDFPLGGEVVGSVAEADETDVSPTTSQDWSEREAEPSDNNGTVAGLDIGSDVEIAKHMASALRVVRGRVLALCRHALGAHPPT
jgi:hypothetical protein